MTYPKPSPREIRIGLGRQDPHDPCSHLTLCADAACKDRSAVSTK